MLHYISFLALAPLTLGQNANAISADYRYKVATVSPTNNYQLHCSNIGACENAQLTMLMERGSSVTDITSISMSGQSAARDSTIRIQNEQGSMVKIHEIVCSGYDSCVNTQFLTGYDVALLSLTCAPGACIGCEVRFDATSPAIPCAPAGSEGVMPAVMPTPQPTMQTVQTQAPVIPVNPVNPVPVTPVTPSPTMLRLTPAPTVPVVPVVVTPAPNFFVRTPAPSVFVPVVTPSPVVATPLPTMPTPMPTAPTPAPVTRAPSMMPTAPTRAPTMPTPAPVTTAAPTIPMSPITSDPLRGVTQFVCHGEGLCAMATQQIVNPQNGFYMFCTDRACTNTQFTISLTQSSAPVDTFFGFMFQGERAAAGATILIDNMQTGTLDLGTIQCQGLNACADTQFIMGYATSITAVTCGPGACPNCMVKTTMNSSPWPCDPSLALTPTLPPSVPTLRPNPVPVPPPVPQPVPAPVPAGNGGGNIGVPAGTEVKTSPRNIECFGNACEGRSYRINNPLNAFFVYCGDLGSCRGSTMNFWYTGTGYTRFERIECKGEDSCAGATFRVNNNQRRDVVEVKEIVCDATRACQDATFDMGYEVAVGAVHCEPGACAGCKLTVGGMIYNCDPQQV